MGEFGSCAKSCRQTEFPTEHHCLSLLANKALRRFIIRFYFIPLTVCDIRQTTVVVYRSMNKKCEYIFVQLIVMYLLNMLEMLRFMFARRIGSLVVVARALYQVVRFRAVAIGY